MRGSRRMQVLAPALWAALIAAAFALLLTRVLRQPVASWLQVPLAEGGWALLVAVAVIATLGLGGASLWHALMLRRLVRVRRVDRLIGALGVGMALLAFAIGVAGAIDPALARAALLLALPLWAAGLGVAVLALAMLIHARAARAPRAPGTVLILGAGLRGRDVGPLLRRRVQRGAEVWRAALSERPDARIVVSGGQGPDEVRTEASAMAEHLERQLGVPASAIDLEEASTTTRENLLLSRPLVSGPGRGPLAVVTSEYHAYRTAGLLAEAGIDGAVIGAWTRPSYRPGATVREALAIAADLRWWCVWAAVALEALAIWVLATRP
ncbi:YdcF family protein [Agrococcus sp. DT81.2]|uniref:YdcF family protein n=1 Tax=Agrococcus sp. DT81.2 TaxID=3393414 RepID=UPI003CE45193